MRLLTIESDGQLRLTQHLPNDAPRYAILSHTWGDDAQEVTYSDIVGGIGKGKKDGYRKIEFCKKQALSDGLLHFWIDTCCINKADHAELSEAIVSMFKWYQKSSRCYVYMADVSKDESSHDNGLLRAAWKLEFQRSRWFKRGWTLQELLAPQSVEFFSKEHERLGDRHSLEHLIHDITGISIEALQGRELSKFPYAERKAWSRGRETKREEDRAYSLMGVLDVFFPPLYGEGLASAFRRLENELSNNRFDGSAKLLPFIHPTHASYPSADEPPSGEAAMSTHHADAASKGKVKEELMKLLHFEAIDVRLWTLKAAHRQTCKWILRKEEYQAEMSATTPLSQQGFLWIKGKPGAGKSVMVKFLFSEAAKAASSNGDALILSFFFNARGEALEKSTIGLYRSLLWQLLEQTSDLREVLEEFDPSALRFIKRNGWQLEHLEQAFAKAIERFGKRKLFIFIDALDECRDEEVSEMISFFTDARERAIEANVRLHICFSSRHYPSITIPYGTQIVLEDQPEHSTDISRYIKSKLHIASSREASKLMSRILEKSEGVFLWVALVIPMLNKADTKGRPAELQKCLDVIPPGLDDLFQKILTRDNEDLRDLRLCVQWILFAKRPLKLHEYYFAICSPDDLAGQTLGNTSLDAMHRFVHNSSKGLAEVTKSRNKSKLPTVQFIHESVRTFFLSPRGHSGLWPDLDGQFVTYSHDVLKVRCLSEINATRSNALKSLLQHNGLSLPASLQPATCTCLENEPFPEISSEKTPAARLSVSNGLPFLEYAVQNVLYHEDSTDNQPEAFIQEFPLQPWIFLNNLFEKFKIRRYTPQASLLYILAELNLPRLIEAELRQVPTMDVPGERYYYPLIAACVNGNIEAAMALLNIKPSHPNRSDLAIEIKSFGALKQKNQLPIFSLVKTGFKSILMMLLATEKVDFDLRDKDGRTPLSWAAENGHESIVRLLLETGKVEVDSRDRITRSPLSWAAKNGHESIVRVLLETGEAKADSGDRWSRSPLSFAAGKGHESIVRLLLETGEVEADSRDHWGQSPLLFAAEAGHESMVRLLLETGKVEVDSRDRITRSPLSWAAQNGHESIVRLLLETGEAKADSRSDLGQTPLSFAAQYGHESIVRLLLETGEVEADSEDKMGRSPLSWAAEMGLESIFRLLLETGKVEVDSRDMSGQTPLSLAAKNGHESIARLLLETGKVEVDSRDNGWGKSPLSWAAQNGHESIVRLLLEIGKVEADSRSMSGRSPLSWAAENGHESTVRLLIETCKVEVDSKDNRGRSPLSWAAPNGHTKIVDMLRLYMS